MRAHILRVLHVTAGNLFGGIERMVLAFVAAQDPDCGHDVAVSFDARLASELRDGGHAAHVLGVVRFSRPDTVWRARRALRRAVTAGAYDALICHAPWSCALAGPVARRTRRPLLMWVHDAPQSGGWPERKVARVPPDRFICNSRHTETSMTAWLPQVRRDVVHPPVLPAPLVSTADRLEIRRELGASDKTTVILLASRMEEWKGHRVLLEAVARLRGDVHVWIAGGAQRPSEIMYFDELSQMPSVVSGRVRMLGERNDVTRLMAAADLYCQPNTSPEPFGIAFVEALAAGVPVVTTAIGGAVEIVDASCGVLVSHASPARFADALQRLIDAPATRATLSAAGPARARSISDPGERLAAVRDLVRAQVERSSAA